MNIFLTTAQGHAANMISFEYIKSNQTQLYILEPLSNAIAECLCWSKPKVEMSVRQHGRRSCVCVFSHKRVSYATNGRVHY